MRLVRTEIEIKEGVKVGVLFTPRLYSFKGRSGVDFLVDSSDHSQVFALYADVMFCAALNLWTLEGKMEEDFPYTRADFHEFSMMNPQGFGKAVNFALEALTGKGLKDLIAETKEAVETEANAETDGKEVKKKNRSGWITRLLRRSL